MAAKGEVGRIGSREGSGLNAGGRRKGTEDERKSDKRNNDEKRGGKKGSERAGDQVKQRTAPTTEGPNQGKNGGKKKKRRGGRRGQNNKEEGTEGERGRKERRNRPRRLQRVYAWYRCKACNRHWESSQTRRVIGTNIVPYKQGCKKCQEKMGVPPFTGPYRTECFECGAQVCDCGRERNNYYGDFDYPYDDDDSDYSDGLEYERHVDDKKPHLSELCEKCLKGIPCVNLRIYSWETTSDSDSYDY